MFIPLKNLHRTQFLSLQGVVLMNTDSLTHSFTLHSLLGHIQKLKCLTLIVLKLKVEIKKAKKRKKSTVGNLKSCNSQKSRMLKIFRQPVMSRTFQMKRNEYALQVMKKTKL